MTIKGAFAGLGGGPPHDTAYTQRVILNGAWMTPVGLPATMMAGAEPTATDSGNPDSPSDGVPGLGPWPKGGTSLTALQVPQLTKWLTAMSWQQWRTVVSQYIYALYDKHGKITNAKADKVWIDDYIDQTFSHLPAKGGINEVKTSPIQGGNSDAALYYAIVEKTMGSSQSHSTGPDGSGTDLSKLGKNLKKDAEKLAEKGPLGLPWLWWGVGGGLGLYLWLGRTKKGKKVA